MADDYDLKPLDAPKKTPPAAETPSTPAPQPPAGFVPPTPIIEPPDPVTDEHGHTLEEHEDIEKHKGMAILGYIFFIIPLLAAPKSKFARYHANQGLLVFILGFASIFVAVVLYMAVKLLAIVFTRIGLPDFFASLFGCVVWLLTVVMVVYSMAMAVIGIINAANGESKPLPLFGRYTLIK